MDNNFLSPYLNSLPRVYRSHYQSSASTRARRTLKATEFKEDDLEKRYRSWLVALTTGNIPAMGLALYPTVIFTSRAFPYKSRAI